MDANESISEGGAPSKVRSGCAAPEPSVAGFRLIVGALLVVAGLAWWRGPRPGGLRELPPVQSRVDPNESPWWELSTLPRIGRATAEAIIAHRREIGASSTGTHRVYQAPADLSQVRGIGPVTVQRLAPHLRFDAPATLIPQRPPAPNGDDDDAS